MKFRIIFLYLIIPSVVVKASIKYIPVATFQHQIALDDRTCAVGDTVFSEVLVRSKIQCALTCMKSNTCKTVFYDSSARKCHGCNELYDAASLVPVATGTVHYQIHPSCEDGWYGYMRSCYILTARDTFYNGVAECVTKGGHAVYIESSEENEYLKSYMTADESTLASYIGITDCAENGVWRTFGNEELTLFTDFYWAESPAMIEYCCALMYFGFDYQWSEGPCINSSERNFSTICEIEIPYGL